MLRIGSGSAIALQEHLANPHPATLARFPRKLCCPPHKGEGGDWQKLSVLASPSPLWGGIKGGGGHSHDVGADLRTAAALPACCP